MTLSGKRLLMKEGNGVKVIDDSYNAAPDSMKSAIKTLMNTEGERHIAVLGGMNELGEGSFDEHMDVGRAASSCGVDIVIGVGEKARAIVEGVMEEGKGYATWYPDKPSLFNDIKELIKEGDTVLVKGSNSLGMTEVADRIVKPEEK